MMGYDTLDDFLERRRHLWVLEIVGPALNGDLKAWWVPPHYIRGVWRLDSFTPREEIVRTFNEPLERLVSAVSESAWGDSTTALQALRDRLGDPTETSNGKHPVTRWPRRRVRPRSRVVVLKPFGAGATAASRRARFGR